MYFSSYIVAVSHMHTRFLLFSSLFFLLLFSLSLSSLSLSLLFRPSLFSLHLSCSHDVITKEFQFSFMREQNKDDKLFFECPAKCGNYLVDVDPTFVLRNERAAVKTERCPCGRGVCVQCHQLVPEPEFYKHRCPETKAEHKYDEAASLQLMKTLGKPCPNCGMFLIKNKGCETFMCGDKAHGSLLKAIKSGGCGQHFDWPTLRKIKTYDKYLMFYSIYSQ